MTTQRELIEKQIADYKWNINYYTERIESAKILLAIFEAELSKLTQE